MVSGNSSRVGVLQQSQVSRPLRVLLDGRKLGDGGIGVYTENALRGLLAQPQIELSVIMSHTAAQSTFWQKAEWYSGVNVVEDDALSYSFDESLRLSKRITVADYDVYHIPHYTLPFGFQLPTVITIHDLIHIYQPERVYYPFIARPWIKSALKRATRVLTVSESTYHDLLRFTGNNHRILSKVRCVPNALDPYYLKPPRNGDYLVTRFNLRGVYLLAVFSNLKPHKRLKDLLRSFNRLQEAILAASAESPLRTLGEIKLVIAGRGAEQLVENEPLLESIGATKSVYVCGSVSKEELLNLYSKALALVVPSVAEGFCLPVIEAQAQGVPVIARPVPAIRELLTDRDFICTDFSEAALTTELLKFIEQAGSGNVKRGWPNLRRFAYDDIGRSIVDVYQEAVDDWNGSVRRDIGA